MIRNLITIMITIIIINHVSAQFYAVHVPLEKLDNLKMDGDTTDWNWVPERYHISAINMIDVLDDHEKNNQDWSCKVIVGWNEIQNRIYILAIIRDNMKSVDRVPPSGVSYLDDCMEVAINPDNMGGSYQGSTELKYIFNTIKFHYSFPLIEKDLEFELYSGPSWYLNREYVDWGGKDYIMGNNHIVTVYEIRANLWDYWSNEGIEYSKESELTFNKKIGLTIAFDDVDSIKDVRVAQWATPSGNTWYMNANELTDFILDGPFESNSWQSIQYLLKPE